MLDLALAIAHHLLIFGIFGILFVELVALRPGLTAAMVGRIARIDLWYGVLAAAVVADGFCRAIFAAKGWTYYGVDGFRAFSKAKGVLVQRRWNLSNLLRPPFGGL